MPQFDIISFFNQVFWLILLVLAFYIFAVRYMLPILALSLKSRVKNLKLSLKANMK